MVGLTSSINSIDLPLSRDDSSKRSLGACWSIIWLNRFHSKRKIRKIVIDAKAFQVSSRPNIRDAAPFVGLLMEFLWQGGVSRTPSSWFVGFFNLQKKKNQIFAYQFFLDLEISSSSQISFNIALFGYLNHEVRVTMGCLSDFLSLLHS